MRLNSITILLLTMLFTTVHAQGNRRSKKYFNRSVTDWVNYHKSAAYEEMEKAIKKDPHNAVAYSTLGEWYFHQGRFKEAADVFLRACKMCNGKINKFDYSLAKSLLYNEQPDSALTVIAPHITGWNPGRWHDLQEQALFVKKQLFQGYNLPLPKPLDGYVNSKYPDMFPCMSSDSSILLFTRKVKNVDEDFYSSSFDTVCKEWFSGTNLGYPPNSIDNDCAQYISADGHYLFFSKSDNRSDNGWAEGGTDLFMTYRVSKDSPWYAPQIFGATINTPDYEGMPSLSPDNKELYFASDRPGGFGGMDIWFSKFENNLWQNPVNAGPGVNSAGDEIAPFIAEDNRTLFFSSNGRVGMGGADLFVSTRLGDTAWSTAKNLGYPINTSHNEVSQWILPNGRTMFFATDRKGPMGNFDLYSVELPKFSQPQPVTELSGVVMDSISKSDLTYAAMYLVNAISGDTVYRFRSNKGDGSFLLPVPSNKKYALHTAMLGFTDQLDTFEINEERQFKHNVVMLPYDYKEPIHDSMIAIIHFNINKVELTPEDNDVLGKAIQPFILDKGVTIYVNGFTDNTGTPILNEELSTKRANLVAEALVKMGVDDLSVIPKGWGEAKMIAPNDTEENQRKNRRVEVFLRRD